MTTSALQHFKVDNFQQTLAITVCHDTGTTRYKKPKKKKKKKVLASSCFKWVWSEFLASLFMPHLLYAFKCLQHGSIEQYR